MIIAIDGPAASGKGTLARRLARFFNLAYLDTGSLYRAVGLQVLRAGGDPADPVAAEAAARALDRTLLDDPALRAEGAGKAASQVAAVPAVRQALLDFQRDFAARPPGGCAGAVLDGRDIGTNVCPDADVKLFVTASAEERARRRTQELSDRSDPAAYDRVLADIRRRDARDSDRATNPLRPAEDALLLDTTDLDIDAVFDRAAAEVRHVLAKAP
ncbi:(d)CMP kinase [Yunchengibacter salinarum]|uniref:(d)CMP kinase n=1 Tax=Yunchengibacter salinarum TaxID=3133399 RepID=UPI0035B574F0